jgi:hypothetical protein
VSTLPLRPIYGWGWINADGSWFNVPPPFNLLLVEHDEEWPPGAAIGQAVEAAHPLSGFWLRIVARYAQRPDYQAYTVWAFRERPNGFAPTGAEDVAELTGFADWGDIQ